MEGQIKWEIQVEFERFLNYKLSKIVLTDST